jgi:hypothetical protein
MEHSPTARIETTPVDEFTEQTEPVDVEYVTARPEETAAVTGKAGVVYVLSSIAPKVMVWFVSPTEIDWVTIAAAL